MGEVPRLVALSCPGCGAALADPVEGLLRCSACGVRSIVVEGRHQAVRVVRARAEFDAEATADRLGASTLGPTTSTRRSGHRAFLARHGRMSLAGARHRAPERRSGWFGVPLDEADGDDLVHLPDPSGVESTDGEVPPLVRPALAHFAFRVEQAACAQYGHASADSSWDDEVLVVHVPFVEVEVHAPALPTSWRYQWAKVKPSGRYPVAVDLLSGGYLRDERPVQHLRPWVTVTASAAAGLILFSVIGTLVLLGPGLGIILSVLSALYLPQVDHHSPHPIHHHRN